VVKVDRGRADASRELRPATERKGIDAVEDSVRGRRKAMVSPDWKRLAGEAVGVEESQSWMAFAFHFIAGSGHGSDLGELTHSPESGVRRKIGIGTVWRLPLGPLRISILSIHIYY
jgi:outer membrane protein assembly factor BamA